jgi:NAD(P)-dependent dehydrogenase (short-subunit alcohol dehydrogenase family)
MTRRRFIFYKCDISKWDNVLSIFEETYKRHGRIDTVLCNAGISRENFLEDQFVPETGKLQCPDLTMLNVNFYGPIMVTKCALYFSAKQSSSGKMRLVLTGSVGSFIDGPGIPLYCGTKAGLLGVMRGLRTLLVEKNMTINLVAPWATGMFSLSLHLSTKRRS